MMTERKGWKCWCWAAQGWIVLEHTEWVDPEPHAIAMPIEDARELRDLLNSMLKED